MKENVKVGNNAPIGANCVVTENVPDNATVVAAYPRILLHEINRDNSFTMI